ncbi:MAG: hypothetical protein PWQ06_1663 [Anaerophaga sp.]|nr:hypothetical protein [Anaerophaga sp.]
MLIPRLANKIDELNCKSYIDDYDDELRQNYFLTKLFGATPEGEIVETFKLTKTGKPTAEQKKIDAAAEEARKRIAGVNYVWLETEGAGNYFHSFPEVVNANGRRFVCGVNFEVCSSISNRIKKSYGNYYVSIQNQANVAVYILNNYTNDMPKNLEKFRGNIYYVHRLVDYHGHIEDIIYAPSKVRFSEAKELIRLYKESKEYSPNFNQCLSCRIRCDKMINFMLV